MSIVYSFLPFYGVEQLNTHRAIIVFTACMTIYKGQYACVVHHDIVDMDS